VNLTCKTALRETSNRKKASRKAVCLFHLEERNGRLSKITAEELKAVLFVKDYRGEKNCRYKPEDAIAGGGKK
jgi:hypothetical protein